MSNFSMLELFRMEVEAQASILNENLLALEDNPAAATELESLMRAAHSVKGAARIVDLDIAVRIAHVMEDCFVAAQAGAIAIDSADKVDILLRGVDLLLNISQLTESSLPDWLVSNQSKIDNLISNISAIIHQEELTPVESLSTLPEPMAGILLEENQGTPPQELEIDDTLPLLLASNDWDDLPEIADLSMLTLFRQEVEIQAQFLNQSLLASQNNSETPLELEALIQAAHLLRGATKIVNLTEVIPIANLLEEVLLTIQRTTLQPNYLEILSFTVNWFLQLVQVTESELKSWLTVQRAEIDRMVRSMSAIVQVNVAIPSATSVQESSPKKSTNPQTAKTTVKPQDQNQPPASDRPSQQLAAIAPSTNSSITEQPAPAIASKTALSNLKANNQKLKSADRVVRVSADNLNRLMGLAGESLVEANWLQPFADSLLKLRNHQVELYNLLERLQESLAETQLNQRAENNLSSARKKANECRHILSERLNELEIFARRSANLSDRLYREVIASHMRPFADGVQGFPRMIRDLARQLGKQVKFEIVGKSTQVDRDILEKLEAPLTHILRNAIDHGIELPDERLATGKSTEGILRLEAAHRGGMLSITVSDDGRGVELEKLRQKITSKGMVSADMASQLTEAELLEFLFLPGFSTAQRVTEISGRGVGLDVVQSMIQEVGGILRAVSQPGKGMSFHLQLPLTLSVIRTLLVEISGEPYAFPLTRIERILMVKASDIFVVENRQFFTLDSENIGLVAAYQVLELPNPESVSELLPVIIVSDRSSSYGLAVDRFLGERALVVRPLDSRLGKVPDISAAALMEDGSPVLIIDVEDMVRSIDKLLNVGRLNKVSQNQQVQAAKNSKHVLVVDDSITVREVERKLLENHGYEVEVAVNGMDGWNAIRTGHYDLVITDVDMPRMNGIELVGQIKNHPNLKSIPVIIVSYKDREEDRIRGMEVGADYYLTKSSFHDDTLLKAVIDLVGLPE